MSKERIICSDRSGVQQVGRRQFMARAGAAVVAIAGLGISGRVANAQPPGEKVSEDDPVAQTFGYRHDTNSVDSAKFPRHDASQKCRDCALYQGGDADWGGCGVFPGKAVSANGWCNAWVQRPG